jgi:diacylglycerol kinase family enzyme
VPNPRAVLLVNPRSGSADADTLLGAAAERGIETRLLRPGDDPAALARAAQATILGVAGGDGTLGAVAGVAVERDLPFFCVPAGTRNHFARDAGYDVDDPESALAVVADGRERRIDVGYAGERLFLNNVSLGVYAHLVHRREHHRRRRAALARLRALAGPHRSAAVTLDGVRVAARVVLVANNAYRLDVLSLGERERLDEGLLHVYVAHGVLRPAWDERTASRVTLGGAARLPVAIDGEPAELDTPAELRVAPGALRLLVPR